MSGHQKVQVKAYAKADAAQYGWRPERHSGAVPVLLRVEAPPGMGGRAPVDLVAVLDVSGRGLAPASRQRIVEGAMKVIIGKLDDKDRLAIVPVQTPAQPEQTYDFMAMNAAGRSDAAERVRLLAVAGEKKLSTALNKASEILKSRDQATETNVGFIILISDGDDTSIINGEKSDINCSVHAFGFRDAHNPKVLHHIAKTNRGTYGILNDEHDHITEAFVASITKITSVVAVQTEVRIGITCEPSKAALSSIESGSFRSEVSDDRRSGKILAGSLQAGAVRSFIFFVDNAGQGDEHDDLAAHFTARFSYYRVTPAESSSAGAGKVQEWADEQKVVVKRGEDGSRLVAAEIVRVEAVNLVSDILGKYDVEQGRPLAGAAADELRQGWRLLRESEYGLEAGDVCLLSMLDGEMREMEASMRRCAGLSYMLSWLTSHTLQHQTRAAAASAATPHSAPAHFAPPTAEKKGAAGVWQETFGRLASGGDCGGSRKRKHYEYEGGHTEMEMIEQRLAYWSKVTYDLPPMVHGGAYPDHLTMVFQQASRESIDRAMFHDVFLAVVHASGRRGGASPSTEYSCGTATESRRPHDSFMG